MFQKIIQWFIKFFTTSTQVPVVEAPKVDAPKPPPVAEPVKFGKVLTKQTIIDILEAEFAKLVGIKELNGDNRHPVIDAIVDQFNGKDGDPYCMYTCSYVIAKTCARLEIDYPKTVYRGGSSQSFYNKSSGQYVISYPQPGAIMVQQNRDDASRGHVGLCTSTLKKDGTFTTVEANTENMIKYRTDRTMSGPATKKVRGFVDVAQAILDQWELENNV